jgi:hypothetical protein
MMLLSEQPKKNQRGLITHARLDGTKDRESPIVEPKKVKLDERKNKDKKDIGGHVAFSSVDIREHVVTSVGGGLSITLDWQHGPTRSISVDAYESIRERQSRMPRGHLRRLSTHRRQQLLLRHHTSGKSSWQDASRMSKTKSAWV